MTVYFLRIGFVPVLDFFNWGFSTNPGPSWVSTVLDALNDGLPALFSSVGVYNSWGIVLYPSLTISAFYSSYSPFLIG